MHCREDIFGPRCQIERESLSRFGMYTGHIILHSGKFEICKPFLKASTIITYFYYNIQPFCAMQIEARSDHTNLLTLADLLKTRLPLPISAVVVTTGGGGQASTNKFSASQNVNSAIRSDCGSFSLEALEGVAFHTTPSVNSARIVVLYR